MKPRVTLIALALACTLYSFGQLNTMFLASRFTEVSTGINKSDIAVSDGGSCIGWITNGSYALYRNVDFGSGANTFYAHVSSGGIGGTITVHLDRLTSSPIASIQVEAMNDWNKFVTKEAKMQTVSGQHDVYLQFSGGQEYLINLAWFKLGGSGMATNV